MTEYEPEIICLDCENNPCLCEEEPSIPEMPPECPGMIETDFWNCENCGVELEYGVSSCHSCWNDIDVDDFEETIEEEKDQNYYYL